MAVRPTPLPATGFDWDHGHRVKCQKHGVSLATIEALFLRPLAVFARYMHRKELEYFEKTLAEATNRRGS